MPWLVSQGIFCLDQAEKTVRNVPELIVGKVLQINLLILPGLGSQCSLFRRACRRC